MHLGFLLILDSRTYDNIFNRRVITKQYCEICGKAREAPVSLRAWGQHIMAYNAYKDCA